MPVRQPTRHGCVSCNTWKPIAEFRTLGRGLLSLLRQECETVRTPPTRFDRLGVRTTMVVDELGLACIPEEHRELCRKALVDNPSACLAYWNQDKSGMRTLVAAVMNQTKGSVNPLEVHGELTLRLNAWPQLRSIENDVWGVWDWGTEYWVSTHTDPFEAETAWAKELERRKLLPPAVP